MKRVLALMLSIMFVFSLVGAGATTVQTRASDLVSKYILSGVPRGDGVVDFEAVINAYEHCDKLGFIYIEVYNDVGMCVKTVEDQYAYNARSHSHIVTYNGVAGIGYRIKVNFYAKLGDIEEDDRVLYSTYLVAE